VGLVPEDRKRDALLLEQSAAKNITLARLVATGPLLRLGAERRVASRLMDRLEVRPPSPHVTPATMSGGNQQKVSIARWLQAEAQVLMLDEPGQGVDVGAKEQIFAVIRELAAEGRAVLVVSQELEELQQVADRVLVMRRGTIAGELSGADINEHRVVELAMGTSVQHLVEEATA
jgi:ABC-type sugar transport system ATPase subunit